MAKRLKKIQLMNALDRYYDTVSRFKKGAQQEFYRISTLKKHAISHSFLSDITSVDVACYRDDRLSIVNEKTGKHISPNTVRLEMALLSNLFNIARMEWGACKLNPVDGVRKPKASGGRTRRLKKTEENKISRYFLSKGNVEADCIFKLALETAMRQGEILSLTKDCVVLTRKVIVLNDTKNGDQRTIPLTDVAMSLIKPFMTTSGNQVFSYTSNGFKSAWRLAMIDLGIVDLHFHDLRHEAISRLVEMGTLNLIEIASISGHRSMSMLKRYSHIDSSKLHSKINKGRKMKKVMFPAYPAIVRHLDDMVVVDIFDLALVVEVSNDTDDWMSVAEVELLRTLAASYSIGIRPALPSDVHLGGDTVMIAPIPQRFIETCRK